MNESALRDAIVRLGRSLFERGLTAGSSGNISVRLDDGWLITPTNACLGWLDPARISKIDSEGNTLSGDKPSKESFLHLEMYGQRPSSGAVVHLHSTHSVAVSILEDIDPEAPIPPLTAYYVMKIGKLVLVPYHAPGDMALAGAVRVAAARSHAVLLANHGPVVAGNDLDSAIYATEELEETARLYLLLRHERVRMLTQEQVADLQRRFPR